MADRFYFNIPMLTFPDVAYSLTSTCSSVFTRFVDVADAPAA